MPFVVSRTGGKSDAAAASGPWADPASAEIDHYANGSILAGLVDVLRPPFSVDRAALPITVDEAVFIENTFSVYFPQYGSIKGLYASNLSDTEKRNLLYHAARVTALKTAAVFEQEGSKSAQFAA
jgi:hypothetical protein